MHHVTAAISYTVLIRSMMSFPSRAADLAGAGNGAVDLQNLGGFARFVTPTHGSFAPTSPMSKSGSSEGEVATSYDLSPELVVVIKKLSKRDSITKVRALEEFEAYLKNNESSVFSILDVWVRYALCFLKR